MQVAVHVSGGEPEGNWGCGRMSCFRQEDDAFSCGRAAWKCLGAPVETSRNPMDTQVTCHSSFAHWHPVILTSLLFSQQEDEKDDKEEV